MKFHANKKCKAILKNLGKVGNNKISFHKNSLKRLFLITVI